MLNKLQIYNYRNITDLELDLGRVNCFVGHSSKSHILEALGVLGAAASGWVDDCSLQYRGVHLPPGEKHQEVFLRAETDRVLYEVTLDSSETDWSYQDEDLWDRGDEGLSRAKGGKHLDATRGFVSLGLVNMDPSSPTSMLVRGLQQFAVYNFLTPVLRGNMADPQIRQPLGLYGGGLDRPLYGTSDEALHISALTQLLTSKDSPPVFGVENLGSTFSPALARVLDVVCFGGARQGKQILFTTDNPSVLDGIGASQNDVRLFLVSQDAEQKIVVRRIAPSLSQSLPLSILWMQGLL